MNAKIIFSLVGLLLVGLSPATWAGQTRGGGGGRFSTGILDYRTKSPHGYLKVCSTNDEDNNGAYYSDSSYDIYSIDGRLFKAVENNVTRTDEIIPWEVALPAGSYTMVGHSATDGGVRVHFVIKTGQRTIVDLDESEINRRRLQFGDLW